MSVNSSLSSNDSLLHPNLSFIEPYIPYDLYHCLITRPISHVYTSFYILSILLLLPLCIFILYLGLQRWRQQHSASRATMTSHSDSATYHMVTMELFGVLGSFLFCCCIYSEHVNFLIVGFYLWTFTWYGETFFHVLTCVERYLAVVHPITYLSLRKERGIRIRNISIGCVWLLCFGGTSLLALENISLIMLIVLLTLSLIVISFCNLSVLWVLNRPGPGEHGGDRDRVDQSKLRAFYTITVILGVLFLRCVWSLVWILLHVSNRSRECALLVSVLWFNLPSSLVLPLLFVLKAGACACCKNTK